MSFNAYDQDDDLVAYVTMLAENAQAQHVPLNTRSIAPRIVKGALMPGRVLVPALVEDALNRPTLLQRASAEFLAELIKLGHIKDGD